MAFGIVKIVHWVICGRVGLNINAKDEERMLLVFCGQRWIRTTEVERQQIYSLPHLATLEFAQTPFGSFASAKVRLFFEKASAIC